MFPTLFDSAWIGLTGGLHFTLATYFMAIMAGFVGAAYIAGREAQALGVDRQRWTDFAIWMLIIGVAGSRIMHVLVDGFLMDYVHLCTDPFLIDGRALESLEPCTSNMQCLAEQEGGKDIGALCHPTDGLCYPQRDCLRWTKFWAGGLTVYGGLLSCALFAYYYFKRHGISFAKMADVAGYGMFFGLFFGRLGCVAAGCCYGALCDVDHALAMQFPTGSTPYNAHFDEHYAELSAQWRTGDKRSLPIYPTQLISSTYAFAIFTFLYYYLRPRKRFDGQVLLTGAILYGICRFGIEFFRADHRGGALGLATSQLVSIPILIGAGYVLVRGLSKAKERAARDAEASAATDDGGAAEEE
jgi:phosphatidylglycerol:prolipoprotein diacylglycerol transferase